MLPTTTDLITTTISKSNRLITTTHKSYASILSAKKDIVLEKLEAFKMAVIDKLSEVFENGSYR